MPTDYVYEVWYKSKVADHPNVKWMETVHEGYAVSIVQGLTKNGYEAWINMTPTPPSPPTGSNEQSTS